MKKNVLIIGLGRLGLSLVESFSKLNIDVIGIDTDEEAVNKAINIIPYAYICDSTKEEALLEIGIKNIDMAIIALGQDNSNGTVSSIMTAILLKRLGVEKIIVRLDDERYKETFEAIGVTEFISPLRIASDRIANRYSLDNIVDYFNIASEFSTFEIAVQENFKPILLTDLNSRKRFGMNIILIQRNSKKFIPNSNDYINPNDHIYAFGTRNDIGKFEDFLNNNVVKK